MKVVKRGSTKDYSMFEMETGNRVFKEFHAVKLAASIAENNMLEACPIICTERGKKLFIIDGQHRLGACRMLQIPVPYIVVSGVEPEDISRLNRDQKGWGSKDYLAHFCALGNPAYIELSKFIAETGMPITLSAAIMDGRINEGGGGDGFRRGVFMAKDLKFAYELFGTLRRIENAGCTFSKDRCFVKAIQIITKNIPEFSVDRMVARMECTKIEKRANWIDYCRVIETAYNYRTFTKNRLHIMAKLEDLGMFNK